MVSFINLVPETLQLLIVGLPKGATFIDAHLAESFQKMLYFKKNKDAKCLVVFIRHEDKEEIRKSIYKGQGNDHKLIQGLRIQNVTIDRDTLPYSWGSATNGKLGLCDNYVREFYNNSFYKFYT